MSSTAKERPKIGKEARTTSPSQPPADFPSAINVDQGGTRAVMVPRNSAGDDRRLREFPREFPNVEVPLSLNHGTVELLNGSRSIGVSGRSKCLISNSSRI